MVENNKNGIHAMHGLSRMISPLRDHVRAQILMIGLALVFSVPTHTHAACQIKAFGHNIRKHVFRQKVGSMPPLYEHEDGAGEKPYALGGSGAA